MLRIAVACEVREEYQAETSDPPDASRDLVSQKYLADVLTCLERMGHTGEWIGDAMALLKRSSELKSSVDFVFNLSEGLGSPNRASAVPLILELLEIPYLGSDAYGQALSLNKYHLEILARDLNIPTPGSALVHHADELDEARLPRFPVITKPVHEGSSLGIFSHSIVSSPGALKASVQKLIRDYRQPALIQRFVAGYEVTVPIVGNHARTFCQPMSVVMDGDVHLDTKIYSSDIKYLADNRVEHKPCQILDRRSLSALEDDVWKLFRFLDLRDYARFDFRVDQKGRYYLIDVNALAYLGTDSSFARAFAVQGQSHLEMIELIVREATNRQGVQW